LMTRVPWNWIPFDPVYTDELLSGSNGQSYTQIELQRVAMVDPEILDPITKEPLIIKPNSRILTEVPSPYYIDESEVPREGVILSERYERTTWFNGRTFLWIGRKKSIGSGEGSSGLRFDSIPLEKKV
jgi:hypothetical protein